VGRGRPGVQLAANINIRDMPILRLMRPSIPHILLALLVLATVVRAGAAEGSAQSTNPRHVDKIQHPKDDVFGDFSRLPWTDAFDATHQTLAREYPFTAWRGIDWRALRDRFRPKVVEAEKNRDAAAFYRALREFVYSIPDSHMDISPKRLGKAGTETYGDLGFEASRLDDGRVIAHAIHTGGPAERSGMTPGAEIVSVEHRPTAYYVHERSTLWCSNVVATNAARELEQVALLSRAPVGATITFEFRNSDGHTVRQETFTAVDDRGRGRPFLRLAAFMPKPDEKLVVHRVLPSGIGYIALFAEVPEMLDEFKVALRELMAANVPGLILDLRLNRGGDDDATALICGYFVKDRRLYQCCQYRNPTTGSFDIADSETVYVEPQQPYFDRQVIVLIGHHTVSNGEGLALQLSHAPKSRTLGFEATAGAFGEAGGIIKLPKDITVFFPYGACVDDQGGVLIDSDARGLGGVEPQIRVPRTYEAMLKFGQGTDVELQVAEREVLGTGTGSGR